MFIVNLFGDESRKEKTIKKKKALMAMKESEGRNESRTREISDGF